MPFFKKETDEEKTERKAHEKAVKEAYKTEFEKAEIEGAKERGQADGKKAGATKKNNGLLATIGRVAEGTVKGINKGADVINKGVGLDSLEIRQDDTVLAVPKGNSDIFFEPKRNKKKRKEDPYFYW